MAEAAAKKLSPKQNTKIEVLAEAVETIAMATAAQILSKTKGEEPSDMALTYLADARLSIREALRDFLQPALMLIEGGLAHVARQPYTEDEENPAYVPLEDRVKCGECKRHFICSDVQCPHWHKAVRDSIEPAKAPEVPGGNVA